jgi:hypothetical protein
MCSKTYLFAVRHICVRPCVCATTLQECIYTSPDVIASGHQVSKYVIFMCVRVCEVIYMRICACVCVCVCVCV